MGVSQSQPISDALVGATESPEPSAACGCIAEMNGHLASHNAGLVTTMFSTPERVCVETYKVDDKKRGFRPPKVLATYCPFCGANYGKEAGA